MIVDITIEKDEQFRDMCKRHNWRRTAQRRAVFDYLCGNRQHPSVETVWKMVRQTLPDVSLDSVYRILDAFAEAGLIQRLEGGKLTRYDADTAPHGHFVCTECGSVFDFPFEEADQAVVACCDLGSVSAVEITVRGLCRSCRAMASEKSPSAL